MLLPKEDKFFDLFDKQAENLVHAAQFYHKAISEANFWKLFPLSEDLSI